MIGLGIKSFIRNILLNIFIIFQLTAVTVTCGALISSAESRYDIYMPFKELLDGEGEIIFIPQGRITDAELRETASKLHKTEYLSASYSAETEIAPLSVSDGYAFHGLPVIIAYDKELLDLYSPEISKGMLAAGECLSGMGSIGEKYRLTLFSAGEERLTTELRVSGVLADKGEILGADSFNTMTVSCRRLTNPYYRSLDEGKGTDTVVLNAEDIRSLGAELIPDGIGVLKYSSPLSDAEKAENDVLLNSFCAHAPFERVRGNTVEDIRSQLMILLPIAVMLVITVCICVVCSGAVKAKKQQHSYAVYALIGANRDRLFLIGMTEMAMCSILSLILSRGISLLLPAFEITSGLTVRADALTVGTALLIAAAAIAAASLISYAMTRRLTIKQLLCRE